MKPLPLSFTRHTPPLLVLISALSIMSIPPLLHASESAQVPQPSVTDVGRSAVEDSTSASREKVVCRFERRTGTRMKTKVCRTLGQMADERESAIRVTKNIQKQRRVKQGN